MDTESFTCHEILLKSNSFFQLLKTVKVILSQWAMPTRPVGWWTMRLLTLNYMTPEFPLGFTELMTFSARLALQVEEVTLEGDLFQYQKKEKMHPGLKQVKGVSPDRPTPLLKCLGLGGKTSILCSPKSQVAKKTSTQ